MHRTTFALLIACAACGSQRDTTEPAGEVSPSDPTPDSHEDVAEQETGRPEPAWPAEMPSQLGCATEAECVYLNGSYPISPCCSRTGETAASAAWLAKVGEIRASGQCEGVRCAALELPSSASHGPTAPECAARCVDGACTFRCAATVGGEIPP